MMADTNQRKMDTESATSFNKGFKPQQARASNYTIVPSTFNNWTNKKYQNITVFKSINHNIDSYVSSAFKPDFNLKETDIYRLLYLLTVS